MDLAELQKLAGEWREKTYPGSTLQDITQKLAEEVGEVNGAAFKYRWADTNPKRDKWWANLMEEVGDAGLVLLSICEQEGWDFESVLQQRAKDKGMLDGS